MYKSYKDFFAQRFNDSLTFLSYEESLIMDGILESLREKCECVKRGIFKKLETDFSFHDKVFFIL